MNLFIVTFLLFIVFGLWAAHKKNIISKTSLEILAAIAAVGAFIVIILDLIFLDAVQQTVQNNEQSDILVSSIYDDFNDSNLIGDFDPNRWEKYEEFLCAVELENGQAVFSGNNSSSSNTVCVISVDEVPLEEVGSMEAKLSTTDDAKGNYSIGIIQFVNGTFEEGTETWLAQCGLRHTQAENPTELFFNIHSTYPRGNPDTYRTIPAVAGRWYKIRLEVDPDFKKVHCYANDKIIGTYNPPNKNLLTQDKFSRSLVGYWIPGAQATFFADDVYISSIE